MVKVAWLVRPPTTLEAQPLAQGFPLDPRGELLPRGCLPNQPSLILPPLTMVILPPLTMVLQVAQLDERFQNKMGGVVQVRI